MLTVRIIAVGRLRDRWLRDGFDEYIKRLGAYCRIETVEIDEYRLSDSPSQSEILRGLEHEGKAILKKAENSLIIPLCIEGEQTDSKGLSLLLEKLMERSSCISFVIGGSFGLSDEVKNHGAKKLSMSPMTFPHQLARVMLSEQLYRAFSIINGQKYHK